jgi:nitroreductase
MNTLQAIKTRYTYRGEFTDRKLSDKEIKEILEAAIAAPCGMHNYTTSFVAITDEDIIKQISEVAPINGVKTAPFLLVVLTEKENSYDTMHFEEINYGAAVENILIAVTDLSLATVWADGTTKMPNINKAIRKILNVPEDKIIKSLLPIGEPKKPHGPTVKLTIDKVVTFNKFK